MDDHILKDFRQFIRSLSDIPDEDIDLLVGLATKSAYKTDDLFSTPNTPSTSIAFVAKGLFRLYVIDKDGDEATLAFTGENMFMSSYGAIILNQVRPIYIQAIEDSEVYTISRTTFMRYWETNVNVKDLLHKVTELDCIRISKRELGFLLNDAQTRYYTFLNDFPKYANRIKLRFIASYLGISPETLSRLRNKCN